MEVRTPVRRALRVAVRGWLVLQLAGFVAAPVMLCSHHQTAGPDSHAACCPGVGPGQVCPMHKTREGASKCTMSSACQTADAALLSLFTSIGVTPHSSFILDANISTDRILALSESPIARADLPESPPPRI